MASRGISILMLCIFPLITGSSPNFAYIHARTLEVLAIQREIVERPSHAADFLVGDPPRYGRGTRESNVRDVDHLRRYVRNTPVTSGLCPGLLAGYVGRLGSFESPWLPVPVAGELLFSDWQEAMFATDRPRELIDEALSDLRQNFPDEEAMTPSVDGMNAVEEWFRSGIRARPHQLQDAVEDELLPSMRLGLLEHARKLVEDVRSELITQRDHFLGSLENRAEPVTLVSSPHQRRFLAEECFATSYEDALDAICEYRNAAIDEEQSLQEFFEPLQWMVDLYDTLSQEEDLSGVAVDQQSVDEVRIRWSRYLPPTPVNKFGMQSLSWQLRSIRTSVEEIVSDPVHPLENRLKTALAMRVIAGTWIEAVIGKPVWKSSFPEFETQMRAHLGRMKACFEELESLSEAAFVS